MGFLFHGILEYKKLKIADKNGKSGDLPRALLCLQAMTAPAPPVGIGLA